MGKKHLSKPNVEIKSARAILDNNKIIIIIIIIIYPLLSNLGTTNRITQAVILYIICHQYLIIVRCFVKQNDSFSSVCFVYLLSLF